MRLWSLHPRYLDPAGLVALWREGLLAQAVLAGRTRGYTRHPQLERFREHPRPLDAIANYLNAVADEADQRGYRFDRSRLLTAGESQRMRITRGQLLHEWQHLGAKLRLRNPAWHRAMTKVAKPESHPSFRIVAGGVAEWERV